MNIRVKFLLNYPSVTYSSFFLISRPFFVCDGDKGDEGDQFDMKRMDLKPASKEQIDSYNSNSSRSGSKMIDGNFAVKND